MLVNFYKVTKKTIEGDVTEWRYKGAGKRWLRATVQRGSGVATIERFTDKKTRLDLVTVNLSEMRDTLTKYDREWADDVEKPADALSAKKHLITDVGGNLDTSKEGFHDPV